MHHPLLAECHSEQVIKRAEIEILLGQAEHRLAAFAVERLHHDIAVGGAKLLDRGEVAGDQGRRHQLGKFHYEHLFRRVAHLRGIVDDQRLRLQPLEQVGRRDVSEIERRVLAQQHHVECAQVGPLRRP